MVNIENYLSRITALLQDRFGQRLLYVGLQGSYLRGEATDSSDIDIMVILDELSVADLDAYRAVVQTLEAYDKSCGFICAKDDLANWNPLEICSLLHSTRDFYGELQAFTPAYTEQDIRNFTKMSLNNLYHEICHRYIHADSCTNAERLPGTYKGTFFILQSLHYLRTGCFVGTKAELLTQLKGKDQAVLERAMKERGSADFRDGLELLFGWCQETLRSL